MCITPGDKYRRNILYLECLFYTSLLPFVSENFSCSQESGKQGFREPFPYSKTISRLFIKYYENKSYLLLHARSKHASIPFYFYLIMQWTSACLLPVLHAGWLNISQYVTSTSRNNFKWILTESLLYLVFHRVGSTTNWQGILKIWNSECFLSLGELTIGCHKWKTLDK